MCRFHPPDTRLQLNSGSNKRPYRSSVSSNLLTNDGFDDGSVNIPVLTDGSPVYSELVELEPKRQCVDDYEISLSATDVPMNLREALRSNDVEQ